MTTQPQTEPRLLTVAQAAERLNVGERHIRRLIFERRIPYVKYGPYQRSPVRIPADAIDAYIEAGRVAAWTSAKGG